MVIMTMLIAAERRVENPFKAERVCEILAVSSEITELEFDLV